MLVSGSPSQTFASAIVLGLIMHQVCRKYETCSVVLHTARFFIPPLALSLFASPPQWTLWHTILIAAATYTTTLLLSVVAYRLLPVHPLSQFPGPIGCKVSKFWMAFISIRGFQHQYIMSLHDRYGDVVRIGPNELSIRDATAVHALLGPTGAPKGPHHLARTLNMMSLVAIMDTDEHLRQRRSWAYGMAPAAIKEYKPFIARRVRQLIECLAKRVGEEIKMDDWFSFFTYDLMSDFTFGGGSELMAAGTDEGNIWALFEESFVAMTMIGHVPWLADLLAIFPAVTGNVNVLISICGERVKGRLARGSVTKDLFHYLNHENLPDKAAPPTGRLVDNGMLAINAGSDTISSALTSLMFSLLRHPDCYQKLQEEIDRLYPLGEDPLEHTHYGDMPYLTAVINETLRVFPPVPGGSQRQVPVDSAPWVFGNIAIPPGTIFWLHIYSTHHDSRSFSPYTSEFWPERWLLASGHIKSSRGVTSSSAEFRHNEAGFLPFSIGPMNCVGKALALQELRMTVCALLQVFRVRSKAEWDPRTYEREYRDYFTATRPEVPVVLELRS